VFDLSTESGRKAFIRHIESAGNTKRKIRSVREMDVYQDRQEEYVKDYLIGEFDSETVQNMPVVSSINLCRRLVNQESTIYKKPPTRRFVNVTEEQSEVLQKIYDAMDANSVLFKANNFYKLQLQNLLYLIPNEDKKLELRTLLNHYYDPNISSENPEKAEGYAISGFKYSFSSGLRERNKQEVIGDKPDHKIKGAFHGQTTHNSPRAKSDGVFVVWTRENNFIMDSDGKIISEDDLSPIKGYLPFIDIAREKNFEYFIDQGNSVVDFSIQYNGSLSDLANIVRNQGWAQAVFTGSEDSIPKFMKVGPTYAIRLIRSPRDTENPDFKYVNPSPDVAGSIAFTEMLLANFLSSRGIDPKTVSGKAETNKYSSGTERLLAQIEKFEASQADYILFSHVEDKLFDLIRLWHNEAPELLDPKFVSGKISQDAYVEVEFEKPELVTTEKETLDNVILKLDNKLATRKMVLKELYNLDDEAAEELEKELAAANTLYVRELPFGGRDEDGDTSDVDE